MGRAVVLLIGMIMVAVGIQAKCFAEQPIGMFHICTVGFVEGLVAQAGYDFAAWKRRTKAELLFLFGTNVKAFELHVAHCEFIAI